LLVWLRDFSESVDVCYWYKDDELDYLIKAGELKMFDNDVSIFENESYMSGNHNASVTDSHRLLFTRRIT
jgi:hypothetical protein